MRINHDLCGGSAEYDTARIMDVADVETVVEYLGIDSQRRGSRISILCPAHADKHFGSCFLTRRGFHCFACGARGDLLDLVRLEQNCSFTEACEFVCSIYGDIQDFQAQSDKPRTKLLDEESLKVIGLSKSMSVSIDVAAFSFQEDADTFIEDMKSDNEKFHIHFEPLTPAEIKEMRHKGVAKTKMPDGHYRVMRTVETNPLLALAEQNETAYRNLIAGKAKEAAAKYRMMIDMAEHPDQYSALEDRPELLLMMLYTQEVIDRTSFAVWKNHLQYQIRRCENIVIEYDTNSDDKPAAGTSVPKPKKSLNLFGQIKGSTSF